MHNRLDIIVTSALLALLAMTMGMVGGRNPSSGSTVPPATPSLFANLGFFGSSAPGGSASEQTTTLDGPCIGCLPTSSVHSFWVPGLTSDSNGPDDRPDDWKKVGEDWYREFSDGRFTANVEPSIGIEAEVSLNPKVQAGAKVSASVGFEQLPSQTCLKCTRYLFALLPGDCSGTYPNCASEDGCTFRIEADIEVIGRLTGSEWFRFSDDNNIRAPRRESEDPNESTINLVSEKSKLCDNSDDEVRIRYDNDGWWFSDYVLFSQSCRCTSCPGSIFD